MQSQPLRIAMWSGPRNISTAMMRSWGNRPDTAVCDEPLYAHYLLHTGIDHPGRDDVIAAHETDWRKVVNQLLGPVPSSRPIYYQKHMAHHLLPHIERGWLDHLTHCFLIRHPAEMLTSLVRNLPNPTLADTGLPQQLELWEQVSRSTRRRPPILDARDVLENPREQMTLLCAAVGVPFVDQMLSWPAGPRDTDGVWARHWYDAVEKSTSFQPYRPKNEPVPARLAGLFSECMAIYHKLHPFRLGRSEGKLS